MINSFKYLYSYMKHNLNKFSKSFTEDMDNEKLYNILLGENKYEYLEKIYSENGETLLKNIYFNQFSINERDEIFKGIFNDFRLRNTYSGLFDIIYNDYKINTKEQNDIVKLSQILQISDNVFNDFLKYYKRYYELRQLLSLSFHDDIESNVINYITYPNKDGKFYFFGDFFVEEKINLLWDKIVDEDSIGFSSENSIDKLKNAQWIHQLCGFLNKYDPISNYDEVWENTLCYKLCKKLNLFQTVSEETIKDIYSYVKLDQIVGDEETYNEYVTSSNYEDLSESKLNATFNFASKNEKFEIIFNNLFYYIPPNVSLNAINKKKTSLITKLINKINDGDVDSEKIINRLFDSVDLIQKFIGLINTFSDSLQKKFVSLKNDFDILNSAIKDNNFLALRSVRFYDKKFFISKRIDLLNKFLDDFDDTNKNKIQILNVILSNISKLNIEDDDIINKFINLQEQYLPQDKQDVRYKPGIDSDNKFYEIISKSLKDIHRDDRPNIIQYAIDHKKYDLLQYDLFYDLTGPRHNQKKLILIDNYLKEKNTNFDIKIFFLNSNFLDKIYDVLNKQDSLDLLNKFKEILISKLQDSEILTCLNSKKDPIESKINSTQLFEIIALKAFQSNDNDKIQKRLFSKILSIKDNTEKVKIIIQLLRIKDLNFIRKFIKELIKDDNLFKNIITNNDVLEIIINLANADPEISNLLFKKDSFKNQLFAKNNLFRSNEELDHISVIDKHMQSENAYVDTNMIDRIFSRNFRSDNVSVNNIRSNAIKNICKDDKLSNYLLNNTNVMENFDLFNMFVFGYIHNSSHEKWFLVNLEIIFKNYKNISSENILLLFGKIKNNINLLKKLFREVFFNCSQIFDSKYINTEEFKEIFNFIFNEQNANYFIKVFNSNPTLYYLLSKNESFKLKLDQLLDVKKIKKIQEFSQNISPDKEDSSVSDLLIHFTNEDKNKFFHELGYYDGSQKKQIISKLYSLDKNKLFSIISQLSDRELSWFQSRYGKSKILDKIQLFSDKSNFTIHKFIEFEKDLVIESDELYYEQFLKEFNIREENSLFYLFRKLFDTYQNKTELICSRLFRCMKNKGLTNDAFRKFCDELIKEYSLFLKNNSLTSKIDELQQISNIFYLFNNRNDINESNFYVEFLNHFQIKDKKGKELLVKSTIKKIYDVLSNKEYFFNSKTYMFFSQMPEYSELCSSILLKYNASKIKKKESSNKFIDKLLVFENGLNSSSNYYDEFIKEFNIKGSFSEIKQIVQFLYDNLEDKKILSDTKLFRYLKSNQNFDAFLIRLKEDKQQQNLSENDSDFFNKKNLIQLIGLFESQFSFMKLGNSELNASLFDFISQQYQKFMPSDYKQIKKQISEYSIENKKSIKLVSDFKKDFSVSEKKGKLKEYILNKEISTIEKQKTINQISQEYDGGEIDFNKNILYPIIIDILKNSDNLISKSMIKNIFLSLPEIPDLIKKIPESSPYLSSNSYVSENLKDNDIVKLFLDLILKSFERKDGKFIIIPNKFNIVLENRKNLKRFSQLDSLIEIIINKIKTDGEIVDAEFLNNLVLQIKFAVSEIYSQNKDEFQSLLEDERYSEGIIYYVLDNNEFKSIQINPKFDAYVGYSKKCNDFIFSANQLYNSQIYTIDKKNSLVKELESIIKDANLKRCLLFKIKCLQFDYSLGFNSKLKKDLEDSINKNPLDIVIFPEINKSVNWEFETIDGNNIAPTFDISETTDKEENEKKVKQLNLSDAQQKDLHDYTQAIFVLENELKNTLHVNDIFEINQIKANRNLYELIQIIYKKLFNIQKDITSRFDGIKEFNDLVERISKLSIMINRIEYEENDDDDDDNVYSINNSIVRLVKYCKNNIL